MGSKGDIPSAGIRAINTSAKLDLRHHQKLGVGIPNLKARILKKKPGHGWNWFYFLILEVNL